MALLTCAALAIRVAPAQESLWIDELHTAWTVADGWQQIGWRAAIGNLSPAYFVAPWLSTRLFGMSELSLRLPSLLCGTLLIPGIFLLVRRWTRSNPAALLAAALATIDEDFIFYAQEARPYAAVQFVALAHLAVLDHLLQAPRWSWRALWIVSAVTLFYLHYTTALLLLAELVALTLLWYRGKTCYRPDQWLGDLTLTALLCLPAAAHLLAIAARRGNWSAFIEDASLKAAATVLPLGSYVLSVLILAGMVSWFRGTWRARRTPGWYVPWVITLCAAIVPVVCVWLSTATGLAPLLLNRYVIASAVAVVLLSGLGVALLPPIRWQITAVVWVLIVALLTTSGVHRAWRGLAGGRNENWRAAIRWINEHSAGEDPTPVLIRSGLIEANALRHGESNRALHEYASLPVGSLYALAQPHPILPLPSHEAGRLDRDARELIEHHGSAWFLLRGSDALIRRITNDLERSLAPRKAQITRQSFFKVTVLRVELSEPKSDDPSPLQ